MSLFLFARFVRDADSEAGLSPAKLGTGSLSLMLLTLTFIFPNRPQSYHMRNIGRWKSH